MRYVMGCCLKGAIIFTIITSTIIFVMNSLGCICELIKSIIEKIINKFSN